MGEEVLHRIVIVLSALLVSCATLGKKDAGEGVMVTIKVMDEGGKPIPTAVVRHPKEADPHRVNSLNGEWYASVLYLPGGGELVFSPGDHLQLEVSAPGYLTRVIGYDIHKRKNAIEVTLKELVVDDSDIVEPTLEFGRDKPREGMSTGASN
jgi:hypothetical protein